MFSWSKVKQTAEEHSKIAILSDLKVLLIGCDVLQKFQSLRI